MRKITKYLAATAVLSFALTINANAAVKSVTITAPTKSASYTACSELGTGMQIIQGIKVAAETVIGAGAVVVKDIEEKGTWVGSPAKRIK